MKVCGYLYKLINTYQMRAHDVGFGLQLSFSPFLRFPFQRFADDLSVVFIGIGGP